jgi:tetratricopeptide (TPR) repeat protein
MNRLTKLLETEMKLSPCKLIQCILLILFVEFAGQLTTLAQPSSQKPAEVSAKASSSSKAPDYSQEALVIELLKTSYQFEKDGTGQHELNLRVKVQSEAALSRFGQLVFPYISANESLDIDYVRVKKADGSVVSASAGDVQDLTAPVSREAPVYTDVRQKHVTVPGLRPGDTLEYHAVWRVHTPLAANQFWLNHDFIKSDVIVLDEQLEVNIPSDSVVKLKTESGFDPTITERGGRRIYNWKHAVLERKEEKDDDKEVLRKRREELEDPKPPQVQMTTFKSWDDVGQWYAGLERDRVVPDEKIKAKVDELIRDRKTDREKIEALYEFVSKNFRYVSLSLGQGRYQPHAAAEVLSNEYGDCKDKHTLFSSMLIAAGLRAYPALMNSSRKIDADVPSPGQFDHVITAIPLGSETLWADTTAEVAPFRLLAPPLRDKKALVIPASGAARLETTPAEPPFVSSELVDLSGTVNDLGQLKGHAHLTLRGDSEMEYRLMFRRTPKSQWKELSYVMCASIGIRGGEATEIKTSDIADLEKPLEIDFDLSNNEFLDWSSKKEKLSLPLPAMALAIVDADKAESAKPIQLGAPVDTTYRLKLSLPAKYQARAPVPLAVNRDYAAYSSSYKLDGNTLIAERTYHLRQHEIPSSRTQDYIAFLNAARADEAQTLSVETEALAGTPAIPDSVKVEDLLQAAEAAANNNNYPMAEALLKRVLEREPKHQTARRQLGYALFGQQKLDEAISVLKEQTRLNPFDDYSYNLLGRAFWVQQKYPDAEVAFRKQIEVTPLDKWAHGNLGLMLVEWRKYKEAVPELEQAISLNPDQEAQYQISLGRAYLNLNQNEKGLAAFDRAVKLAPGQETWNDVAYYLTLSKIQLDKAQQYSESSVTEITTDLRNAELERLTPADIQHVALLAASWDTLGWVYFEKGDFDRAEKYITAAWWLAQHGEIGYHLGQIYEKRGRKDEAIRVYAQASGAMRTVPEAAEGLERLAGKDKLAALLRKGDDETRNSRTINLGRAQANVKGTSEARFFVSLVPGAGGVAQVSDVRFIAGDEKLKPAGELLKTAKFGLLFPDDKMTKVIRRGTLFCNSANGECSFIMIEPEYVTLIE